MGAFALFRARGRGPSEDVVRSMSGAAPHRGAQLQIAVLGNCAVACTTDDLPDATIGITNSLLIAFVGALDNARDLEREIKRHDRLSGRPDLGGNIPTLLAAGYRAYGEELPAHLRGVFAGVVTDGNWVLCFRDHIGYRPVFYRDDAAGFFAASEAKQVVHGAAIPREPDLSVVERIFYSRLSDDVACALRGVARLPKASVLRADGSGVRVRRYWHPESLLETARYPSEELKPRFEALMDQAVSRTLTGRDAVSLSGGIDSPAIAAFAVPRYRELFGRPLPAVSVVYPNYPSVDESTYVALLAEYFQVPLYTAEQATNSLADLGKWTKLADTPYPAASLAHYGEDYRRARKLGFRTILTGEHAEFVFAWRWHTLGHYLTHGRISAAARELRWRRTRGRSWKSLARFTAAELAPDWVHALRNRIAAKPRTVPDWIDARKAAADEESVPVWDRWRRSQLYAFLGPGVSVEAEEVCQAVSGVRSRRPWADVDLWEFFLSLPAEQKFADLRPKGFVRELLHGRVPDAILDRTDDTVFDEAMMAEIDYGILGRYLIRPRYRIDGVNYTALGELLRSEKLAALDYMWARNLATVHAFLSQW
jgi:asparagine synthase (glutamine-hydrolysing)